MYTQHSNRFQQIEIGLASPKEIRSWAERFLPNGEIIGEVTTWETVNYKTLKPEPNGLFCQKIFGPILDYTCACGKKAVKVTTGFCPKCGVERTSSQVRRYRMGYIRLNQPVAHTLYASQKPSPLSLCLNWSNKRLQAILYGTEFCHLPEIFEIFIFGHRLNSIKSIKTNKISKTRKQNRNKDFFKIDVDYSRPHLFQKQTKLEKQKQFEEIIDVFQKQKLRLGIHLYGLAYDMTWRQVEDFQDFLLYMWEQSETTDLIISYYKETKISIAYTKNSIPYHSQYYPLQTGAFVLQKILSYWNLVGTVQQLTVDLEQIQTNIKILQLKKKFGSFLPKSELLRLSLEINRSKQLEKKLIRRLSYFRDFQKSEMQPAWMILSYLPVLPPGLRPITSIRGELVVSDLNSLYRKVLTRNRRLINTTRFGIFDTALSGSWASWCYNLRQVQESVDSLLKTGKVDSGKTTKSLLDSLKGKRGRFRQHLLGKRVDYSGRSVIVVGPTLQIHECGLPKQMALELFQPFLIQQLRNKGIAFTTTGAKAIITERRPIIWTLLTELLQSHPVFLNRAPTLHRLGIQAFIPKLVKGKAILLHPLVCPAFNADFDGDQMAVHVPLSTTARAEAFQLLLARNQLLAPSSGDPLLLPTQDMVLGSYYLTLEKDRIQKNCNLFSLSKLAKNTSTNFFYSNFSEVLEDYNLKKISTHSPVWVLWNEPIQKIISEFQARFKLVPTEVHLDCTGKIEYFMEEEYSTLISLSTTSFGKSFPNNLLTAKFIRTTPGRILMYQVLKKALFNYF